MGFFIFIVVILVLWWWLLGRDPQIHEQVQRDGRVVEGTVLFSTILKGRNQNSAFGTLVGYKFSTQYAKTIFGISLLWTEEDGALAKGDPIKIEYSAKFPFKYNQPVGRGNPR